MDDVVSELRERLSRRRSGAVGVERPEDRLQRACLNGSGHVMVTGSNRAEIDAVLARVLAKIEPLSAIRTLAADAEPYATLDRVIATFDTDYAADNYLDRRDALIRLLATAAQADKSIFIVVDDADDATIEQLERLRTSLEIAPEAIERLRLILVGDTSLPRKLDDGAARALRTRITSCVKMDPVGLDDPDATARPHIKKVASHALTIATAAVVTFCAIVYGIHWFDSWNGTRKAARLALAPTSALPTPPAVYGIRGDEPFLDSPLRIAMAAPAQKKFSTAKPAPTPRARVATNATRGTANAPRPAPSQGSSIDAVMKRFQ